MKDLTEIKIMDHEINEEIDKLLRFVPDLLEIRMKRKSKIEELKIISDFYSVLDDNKIHVRLHDNAYCMKCYENFEKLQVASFNQIGHLITFLCLGEKMGNGGNIARAIETGFIFAILDRLAGFIREN